MDAGKGVFQPQTAFQSAPLTDVRGDSFQYGLRKHHKYVSIRSPHGCKGRCLDTGPTDTSYTMFQSAPLTDVRGVVA